MVDGYRSVLLYSPRKSRVDVSVRGYTVSVFFATQVELEAYSENLITQLSQKMFPEPRANSNYQTQPVCAPLNVGEFYDTRPLGQPFPRIVLLIIEDAAIPCSLIFRRHEAYVFFVHKSPFRRNSAAASKSIAEGSGSHLMDECCG
jgi:hypothetical protein